MRKDEIKYELVVKKPQGYDRESELQHLRSVIAIAERELVSANVFERKTRESKLRICKNDVVEVASDDA